MTRPADQDLDELVVAVCPLCGSGVVLGRPCRCMTQTTRARAIQAPADLPPPSRTKDPPPC